MGQKDETENVNRFLAIDTEGSLLTRLFDCLFVRLSPNTNRHCFLFGVDNHLRSQLYNYSLLGVDHYI